MWNCDVTADIQAQQSREQVLCIAVGGIHRIIGGETEELMVWSIIQLVSKH